MQRYQANKQRCGRRPTVLSETNQTYVIEKVEDGWTPDVLVGRQEHPLPCSWRTLYRMFERRVLDRSANEREPKTQWVSGTPSQRGLNEHSNGLLRRDGLPKQMHFQQIDQPYISV